jgi:acyl-CoA synthetase (AMP-forming)/AMP-acid ligase II
MHVGLVLEMVHSGIGDRSALTAGATTLDYAGLAERSWAAAANLDESDVPAVVYVGDNHPAFPIALFGAAGAGVPFIPLNYRLSTDQLGSLIAAHPGALVVHAGPTPPGCEPASTVTRDAFLDRVGRAGEPPPPVDPELPCVLLYTSGTTTAPKAAVLRHRHLMSYLLQTVEFASAAETDCALVSVPPYHIAGVANLLSNVFAGRRIVYLDRFDPEAWLRTVREEQVTQAMVIPTMLARVVAHLDTAGATDTADAGTPSLRSLSYGGARMPAPVLERAIELFRDTGFVNAYGLTETSSTVALLGPDDHRAALAAEDPEVRARLGSVGRLLPGIELEVRDGDGRHLSAGEAGLLFFRGEQIAGEYAGEHAGIDLVDEDGWFASRDRGYVDTEGYLFIEGRADDTIIRGGENIAPAEIEDVLLACDGIVDAAVVGVADEEWGQRLIAVVVAEGRAEGPAGLSPEELRQRVRDRLRSSKTPEEILFWAELPRTDTGKLLRREIVSRLGGARATD